MSNGSEEMMALLQTEAELHDDLKPYITIGAGLPMIKHPLIFHIPYSDSMNAFINKQYEQRLKVLDKYIQQKKYDSYIFLHERAYRLQAFLDIEELLTGEQFWEYLADIWTDSENIWQNKSIYKKLFKKHLEHKHKFMSEDDKKVYNSLPEQVKVYRGHQNKNKIGFSYTTNKEKAEWFANRFNKGNGQVRERVIPKSKIIAYTNSRSEQEIIISI